MSEEARAELRQRLAEIDEELATLPIDASSRRDELEIEYERLGHALDEQARIDIEAARKRWAVRAGRKGSHTVDPIYARARLVSPVSG